MAQNEERVENWQSTGAKSEFSRSTANLISKIAEQWPLLASVNLFPLLTGVACPIQNILSNSCLARFCATGLGAMVILLVKDEAERGALFHSLTTFYAMPVFHLCSLALPWCADHMHCHLNNKLSIKRVLVQEHHIQHTYELCDSLAYLLHVATWLIPFFFRTVQSVSSDMSEWRDTQ